MNYRTHIVSSLDEIGQGPWDALVAAHAAGSTQANPFLSYASLHASGSAAPDAGWQPQFLTLFDAGDNLAAALPLYVKYHSYGEYEYLCRNPADV